jgi:ribosomal subunit interface protein
MDSQTYTYEFHFDPEVGDTDDLREMVLQQLDRLAKGHTDFVDASIAVEVESKSETLHAFRARIVLHVRPNRIVGQETAEEPVVALRGALDAVERQLREKRAELGRPWEGPENPKS